MQEAEIESIRNLLARAADTGHHLNAIGAVLARNADIGAVLARKGSGLRGRRVAAALHRVAQVRDLPGKEFQSKFFLAMKFTARMFYYS